MAFHWPPSGFAFGKVIRPEPKSLERTVIRAISFRVYSLAKNKAARGACERGLVQIIITEKRRSTRKNAGTANRAASQTRFWIFAPKAGRLARVSGRFAGRGANLH